MLVEEDGDEVFIALADVKCCGQAGALKPVTDVYGNTFMRCPVCNVSYGPAPKAAPLKPTLGDPALIQRFLAYHAENGAWGSLHITLDDGNVEDDSVKFCREAALAKGDHEGAALADMLLRMSKTQRKKLPNNISAIERAVRTALQQERANPSTSLAEPLQGA